MNEFELIDLLTRSLATNSTVLTGPGDDCAVLDLGMGGRVFLLKTDAVVEGVHFLASAEPEKIGHKALARCLSDVAAMAGKPLAALVTLALPRGFDPAFVARIYEGMNALARRYEVAIVGGETTTNPGGMLLSVALLGEVEKHKCVLRSGAREGDGIFVTGELGGSIAGKHLEFEPRLEPARWLADTFPIHAMIDISDGLVNDLRHVLKQSRVGAELLARSIPISRAARLRKEIQPPLAAALGDGEDFELLFTIPKGLAVALVDGWKAKFPNLRLTCIGRITHGPGLALRDKTGLHTLEANGYVHFE
jgi:thiamine-monophosphate kinase